MLRILTQSHRAKAFTPLHNRTPVLLDEKKRDQAGFARLIPFFRSFPPWVVDLGKGFALSSLEREEERVHLEAKTW